MDQILENSNELVQSTWVDGTGLVTPIEAIPKAVYPIGMSVAMGHGRRAVFVVPKTNNELCRLMRDCARDAGDKRPEVAYDDDDDDEDDAIYGLPKTRRSTSVGPYNARINLIKRLFDKDTGYVPHNLSVESHPLQVSLLQALFSPDGPCADHSQTVKMATGGVTKRSCLFFELAKRLASDISKLVGDIIETWSFDITKIKSPRSTKSVVDVVNFPDAKFEDWKPLVPVHRVVYAANGERCMSFVAEIMREKRDEGRDGKEEVRHLFSHPFYAELIPRLSRIRDMQLDNDESRAKDTPTVDRTRAKQCGERRAYPVMGPLQYHIYLVHKSSIALVAAHFCLETYQKVEPSSPLPEAEVEFCERLRRDVELEHVHVGDFAEQISKQHHYECKLQATCALYGECFSSMIDPSNKFMIDDLELRNGLFVLTSVQSNAQKGSSSSNNSDVWLLKVIHHMLKIHDGRLNDRNFQNVTSPPEVESEKKHINGSLSSKIDDCMCRIESNLIAVIVEKVCSYYRMRFDAFVNSDMVEGEWAAIAEISNTNARREAILHKLHHHKGDVQAASTAYTTRPSRDDDDASTALAVVDADVENPPSESSLLTVGSRVERTNLDIDCAVIESVIQQFSPQNAGALQDYEMGGMHEENEASIAREEYERACEVIGWLSLASRKPARELVETCDALLLQLAQAKEFCLCVAKIHDQIQPIYDEEYCRLRRQDRELRGRNEGDVDVDGLAFVQCSDTAMVARAYQSVSAAAVTALSSHAFGYKPSVVRIMLGPPSKWSNLKATLKVDVVNIDEAIHVVQKYIEAISASGATTFFDFTDRIKNYVTVLVAYKMALVEEDSEKHEPVGLIEHSPQKTDINFVKARLGAFMSQRDEWNECILKSIDIAMKLSGAWAGLDNHATKIVPISRRTHAKVAISSIMYMLTICEVNQVLFVTHDAFEFEAFRNGTSENASLFLMAVLCGTSGRRNIAIAHYDALVAFARRSTRNWQTSCCMVEVAFYVLIHARNRTFNITNTTITRDECTVMLHDDDNFVHVYNENREVAEQKIATLEARVSRTYPSSYEWQFSDTDLLTAERTKTLCTSVPAILNQDTGFINYSGVKYRVKQNNGIFKIASGKRMSEQSSLSFDLVFYDDQFGTTAIPGNRLECGSNSSGSDLAHTPELDNVFLGLFGVVSEPPLKSARRQ